MTFRTFRYIFAVSATASLAGGAIAALLAVTFA